MIQGKVRVMEISIKEEGTEHTVTVRMEIVGQKTASREIFNEASFDSPREVKSFLEGMEMVFNSLEIEVEIPILPSLIPYEVDVE